MADGARPGFLAIAAPTIAILCASPWLRVLYVYTIRAVCEHEAHVLKHRLVNPTDTARYLSFDDRALFVLLGLLHDKFG